MIVGSVRAPVGAIPVPTDDGDAAPSSGGGTAEHTYSALTSTGPYTVGVVTWDGGAGTALVSALWNDEAVTVHSFPESSGMGVAFVLASGARSGDLVLTFDGATTDSEISVLSLNNVISFTLLDSAQVGSGETPVVLTGVGSPGVKGIRVFGATNATAGTAMSSGDATEFADVNAGSWRHWAAYDLGDDDGNVSVSGADVAMNSAGIAFR